MFAVVLNVNSGDEPIAEAPTLALVLEAAGGCSGVTAVVLLPPPLVNVGLSVPPKEAIVAAPAPPAPLVLVSALAPASGGLPDSVPSFM